MQGSEASPSPSRNTSGDYRGRPTKPDRRLRSEGMEDDEDSSITEPLGLERNKSAGHEPPRASGRRRCRAKLPRRAPTAMSQRLEHAVEEPRGGTSSPTGPNKRQRRNKVTDARSTARPVNPVQRQHDRADMQQSRSRRSHHERKEYGR